MSSITASPEIYRSLEERLARANKREILFDLAAKALFSLSGIVIVWLLAFALEAVFHFGTGPRKFIYWSLLSVSVTTLCYFTINAAWKLASGFDAVDYSVRLGRKVYGLNDSLSNSLSLYREYGSREGNSIFSPELIDAELRRISDKTSGIDFNSVAGTEDLKKPAKYFALSLFLAVAAFLFQGGELSAAANRIVNYNYGFLDNLGISFTVTPGNAEIALGEDISIRAILNSLEPGFKADAVFFHMKKDDGGSDVLKAEAVGENTFPVRLNNVESGFAYYFEYEGIKSDEYRITAADYPAVKNFRITVRPPEFTGIPEKVQENEGDVFCPEGSELMFELNLNKPVSAAGIDLAGNRSQFSADGNTANGTIRVTSGGDYSFYLVDKEGREGRNYRKYVIKLMKDEAPSITVIEPAQSAHEIDLQKEVLVRSRISDDYGFSGLTLHFRKAPANSVSTASPQFAVVKIPLQNLNATSVEVPYLWSIASLQLNPGDKIEYFLEVTDNAGKSARSELRSLVKKSAAEAFKRNKEEARELKKEFESVYEEAMDLQKDIEELKREIQRNEELGLNEQKKKDLERKLDNFQKNLQSTQKNLEQNMQDLQESNMLNEKTLEQYMELQEMFNRINTPELRKMLDKLREALKKENSEELREAMKNFKFDEEAFRKYMEKAMELLKKIENMQKFGELTQKLDEITQKQEELKDRTDRADQKDAERMKDLSAQQMMIKEQTREFNEELQKLIDEINKMREQMSAEDLEKIKEQMKKSGIDKKMEQSQQQLQNSRKESSQKTQEELLEELRKMNEQMKQSMSNMMDMQDMNSKLKEKLQQILKDIQEMSKRQGDLRDKTQDTDEGDRDEFNRNKSDQSELRGDLAETIDDLMNTTKMGMMLSPELGKEMGNAYNKMEKATDELGKMEKKKATGNQGKAKEALDNAAKMLGDMIGKMGEGSKKGKGNKPGEGNMGQLMERLGQIIAQQMGLNGKMGKSGKQGQDGQQGNDGRGSDPNGIPQQERIEMDRLRLEQMQIQKSLEQLNEELRREQERSGEKVFGDLNEVEKEMKDVIRELSQYRMDDNLKEKQNRILSRMLDARLSQREKDFEPKRESRPGENVSRNSPPEIVLSGPGSYNALKEEFLKMQKEGYTADYEALITKYLMELKRNGLEPSVYE